MGGGFLRGLPFWLGAVIVSFVPTKTLSTIDFVLAPPQGIGNLIFDDALFLSLIMLYFLYAMRYITRRSIRRVRERYEPWEHGVTLGNVLPTVKSFPNLDHTPRNHHTTFAHSRDN